VPLLLTFAAFGTWSRAAADEATGLRPVWQCVIALAALVPVWLMLTVAPHRYPGVDTIPRSPVPIDALVFALVGVAAPIAAFLSLVAAVSSRRPGSRLRAAWRGNLRRILPVTIALVALPFLALSLTGMHLRSDWAAKWSDPSTTELSDMVQQLGDAWTNPAIPADAWRAQHPPQPAGG
jgi:hypothetical protein